MEIKIREAQEVDIAALKDRLREADAKEVIADGNADIESALRQSFSRSSLRYSVELLENGQSTVVAMFGIVPDTLVGESANVWFLGAPEMSKIKRAFVRLSRQVIREFLISYPVLWNYVDARYESSIRWLKSCGAVFSSKPFQRNGVDFYPFTIRRA